MNFAGLKIKIENPVGSKRPWQDDKGQEHFTTMRAAYGEFVGTKGVDKDAVDVYVVAKGPEDKVFVVRQMRKGAWDRFDEEKIILGVDSIAAAKALYLAHYNDPRFCGGIKEFTMEEFKKRLAEQGQRGEKLAAARRLGRALLGAKPYVDQVVATPAGASVATKMGSVSDRLDDVGIGLLAAPYVAKALSGMKDKKGIRGVVGRKADAVYHKIHDNPAIELPGLALVAPGVTHTLARVISRGKAAELLQHGLEAEKMAYLGALRGLVTRGMQKIMPAVATAATKGAVAAPQAAKSLFSAGNIAKGGLLATAGLGLYAGKKGVDAVAGAVQHEAGSMAPATYQPPRVL